MTEPTEPTELTVGEGELLDRQALRRVGGLSTELEDVSEVEYRRVRLERVLLVGVWTSGTLSQAERSLRELAQLAETAGSAVVGGVVQRRNAVTVNSVPVNCGLLRTS